MGRESGFVVHEKELEQPIAEKLVFKINLQLQALNNSAGNEMIREVPVLQVTETGEVSQHIDEDILSLATGRMNYYSQLIADLLEFRIHVKVRLGVGDRDFYERLLLILTLFRQEKDKRSLSEHEFLRLFMNEIGQVCGKDITEIARMMQGSLLLEEPGLKLKLLNRKFWKETFPSVK